MTPDDETPKDTSSTIIRQQEDMKINQPFTDTVDFKHASRGNTKRLEPNIIYDGGHTVWNNNNYAFLHEGDPPDTVNPSLWRCPSSKHSVLPKTPPTHSTTR